MKERDSQSVRQRTGAVKESDSQGERQLVRETVSEREDRGSQGE